MVAIRGSAEGVSNLSQAFFSEATVRKFTEYGNLRQSEGMLRIFAGGNLIGTKGVALALLALAKAKAAGVHFHYQLGGDGPERARLQTLIRKLGLEENVSFASFTGEPYRRALASSHLFLLPSLRESAGLTMMEAMLSGCVPVVADCGGPALIVTDQCGYKVPVSSSRQMVARLAEIVIALDRDRKMMFDKGQAASRRISVDFSDEHYRTTVNAVYRSVASKNSR
jgi:glycosyltransferase involved in cell wall biosynthesis